LLRANRSATGFLAEMLTIWTANFGYSFDIKRSVAMAGTQAGGRKAAATNKQRYGLNFYEEIGRRGGRISKGGGFAMNRELAVEAGRKGGKASRRTKANKLVQSDLELAA
jgi:general stress protein YciG